jgi:hypothetical protein
MFRLVFHASSGTHNTVSIVFGIENCTAIVQPRSSPVAVQVSLMPDTADTVLWAPDFG